MDKRLKYKSWYHKSPSGELGSKISDTPCTKIFANISPRAREKKEKIKKNGTTEN